MVFRRSGAAWLAALALMVAAGAVRAEGRFLRFDGQVKGAITDIITEDLDGDGLKEAIVIHVENTLDPPVRHLTVFRQAADTGFDSSRKIEWTFPTQVSTVDVGDVSPDPGQELVFLTGKGVSWATVGRTGVGPLHQLLPAMSVVAIPYSRGVPYYNFVRDYTGDGKDDVLVVGFFEATFARQEEGYAFHEQKIDLQPELEIQSWDVGKLLGEGEHPMFQVSYYVPQVHSLDANADGRPDLLVNFRNRLLVFHQGEDGFQEQPAESYRIELFNKDPGKGSERRSRRQWPMLSLDDLDGDGRADVVVSQSRGSFGNMESRTVLFWGKGTGLKSGAPDLSFEVEDTVMSVFVHDVNHDGLPDLVLPAMDLGAWTAGKVLITGGITVTWNYFLQTPERGFNPKPDRVSITNLKFNMSVFRLEAGVPNVFGDFNGDGYPDRAVGEDKELLVISLQDGQGQSLGIEERIAVPVSMFNRALDLDRDGLSDLLIHYDDDSEHVSEFHIFLNRGPWTAATPGR